jgi:hypothetical protein
MSGLGEGQWFFLKLALGVNAITTELQKKEKNKPTDGF